MDTATRGLTCRTCAAALRRCWVCGEVVRCAGCQLCLRCEGLLDDPSAGLVRVSAPPVSIPSVRLKRSKAEARPRPTPPTAPSPSKRLRAKRVHAPRRSAELLTPPGVGSAVWYVRAAVVPALMLIAACWCYGYFRNWSGIGLATMCVVGFYLPYVVLTPVRRQGEFFPLGDEGPGLPIVMLIGAALIGGVGGIVLGLFGGERIGTWGGLGIAAIAFHSIYYATVKEKYHTLK